MKSGQVFFEDIEVGTNIPALVKRPTRLTLFLWCATMGVAHYIHYDPGFARSQGLKDVIVNSSLRYTYLIQMVTDWLGESATVRKLSCRNYGPAYPGDDLTCRGVVKDKRAEDREGFFILDVFLENQNKERLTAGTITVSVPLKHRK